MTELQIFQIALLIITVVLGSISAYITATKQEEYGLFIIACSALITFWVVWLMELVLQRV